MLPITAARSKQFRTLALLCQLWCYLGPLLLLPVVLRVTGVDRRDQLLRLTTAQVLNLQIVALVPLAIGVAAIGLGIGALGIICWAIWLAVVLYGYVVGLIGAVKVWRMETWSYPVNIRLVGSDCPQTPDAWQKGG